MIRVNYLSLSCEFSIQGKWEDELNPNCICSFGYILQDAPKDSPWKVMTIKNTVLGHETGAYFRDQKLIFDESIKKKKLPCNKGCYWCFMLISPLKP